MATHDRAVSSLMEQGRRDGRLTTDDLSRELPVQSMDAAEIAGIIDRLEAAGIDVEVDERLTAGRRRPAPERSGEHGRGVGVVDMANPAAPAVSAPGVKPSTGGWIGSGDMDAPKHGTRRSPTWEVGGIDMIPIVAILIAAIVLLLVTT